MVADAKILPERLLEQMTALRARQPGDWSVIAECLEKLRLRENWPVPARNLSDVMQLAANACGWEAGYLKRVLACRKFLVDVPAPQGLPAAFGHPRNLAELLAGDRLPPVTAVEHLKALHGYSPVSAQAFVRTALVEDGRLTTPGVQRAVEAFRRDAGGRIAQGRTLAGAPDAGGQVQRLPFETRVRAMIALAPEVLAAGTVRVLAEPRLSRSAYASPDLILLAEDPDRLVGVDIRLMPRRPARGRLREVMGSVLLASSFFDAYWLVLDNAGVAAGLAGHIQELGEGAVGIAALEEDRLVAVLRPSQPPQVDRRAEGRRLFLGQHHPAIAGDDGRVTG